MAALLGSAKLSDNQRVELYEGGIVWLVQEERGRVVREIRLDSAAVGWLIDFLLLSEERLCRWRDGMAPSLGE